MSKPGKEEPVVQSLNLEEARAANESTAKEVMPRKVKPEVKVITKSTKKSTEKSTKKSTKKRRRRFGSIRCRSCNKWGLTSSCTCSPSPRYAVMIHSKRVPTYRAREIKRVEFLSVQEANKFLEKVATESYDARCAQRCNSLLQELVAVSTPQYNVPLPFRRNSRQFDLHDEDFDPHLGHVDPTCHYPFNMKRSRPSTPDLQPRSRRRWEDPLPRPFLPTPMHIPPLSNIVPDTPTTCPRRNTAHPLLAVNFDQSFLTLQETIRQKNLHVVGPLKKLMIHVVKSCLDQREEAFAYKNLDDRETQIP